MPVTATNASNDALLDSGWLRSRQLFPPQPEVQSRSANRQHQAESELGRHVESPPHWRRHAIENRLNEKIVAGMQHRAGPQATGFEPQPAHREAELPNHPWQQKSAPPNLFTQRIRKAADDPERRQQGNSYRKRGQLGPIGHVEGRGYSRLERVQSKRTFDRDPRGGIHRNRIDQRQKISVRLIFRRPPVPAEGTQIDAPERAGRQRGKGRTPHHQPHDQSAAGSNMVRMDHQSIGDGAEKKDEKQKSQDFSSERAHGWASRHLGRTLCTPSSRNRTRGLTLDEGRLNRELSSFGGGVLLKVVERAESDLGDFLA